MKNLPWVKKFSVSWSVSASVKEERARIRSTKRKLKTISPWFHEAQCQGNQKLSHWEGLLKFRVPGSTSSLWKEPLSHVPQKALFATSSYFVAHKLLEVHAYIFHEIQTFLLQSHSLLLARERLKQSLGFNVIIT